MFKHYSFISILMLLSTNLINFKSTKCITFHFYLFIPGRKIIQNILHQALLNTIVWIRQEEFWKLPVFLLKVHSSLQSTITPIWLILKWKCKGNVSIVPQNQQETINAMIAEATEERIPIQPGNFVSLWDWIILRLKPPQHFGS